MIDQKHVKISKGGCSNLQLGLSPTKTFIYLGFIVAQLVFGLLLGSFEPLFNPGCFAVKPWLERLFQVAASQ